MKLVLVRPKVRKYFKSLELKYLIGTVKIINRNLYSESFRNLSFGTYNIKSEPHLCLPTGIGLRRV